MCTLIALFRVNPHAPLIIAANRDEFYARSTSPPGLLLKTPRAAGGRDLEKGGTWLAVSERGVFAGLTNQRTYSPPDPTRWTRGEIILQAIAGETAEASARTLSSLDPSLYNPFNLLIGDANALFVAYSRPEARRIEILPLPAGIWILPNDKIASPDFPKAGRAEELAKSIAEATLPDLLKSLPALLADHELPASDSIPPPPTESTFASDFARKLQALCVHTPAYGTRSSAIIAIGDRGVLHYLAAEGPPCTTPFTDFTHLVAPESPQSPSI
jgi:uncharacterized protein with NRDE domain